MAIIDYDCDFSCQWFFVVFTPRAEEKEKTEREAELKGGKAYQSLGLIRRTFSPFVPTNIKKL